MKKRAFLLLEVLIGLMLVAICIIPLVSQPLKLYKEEMAHLEQLELERLANWTFLEVKELLLKNEIPWEEFPERRVETSPFPLQPTAIQIPGCKPKSIKRHFTLKGKGEKTGHKNEIYRQLTVYIFLNKHKYEFRLPVKKVE